MSNREIATTYCWTLGEHARRERKSKARSYLGEVFYLGDKPCGGEEVVEALRLNSMIPTRKGACSLCYSAHTVESVSFLEKIRYGHEAE